jgi:hypothetical protein
MKILATTPGKTTRGNRDVVHKPRQHTWTGKAAFYAMCEQMADDLLIFCSRASKEDVQIYVGAAQDLEAARGRHTCHVSGSSNVGAAAKGDIAFPKNIETHFMAMEVMGDVHGKKLEHFGFYATRDAGYTQWGKEQKLGHKFKAAPGCVVYFQLICSSSARIKGLKKTDGLKRVVRKEYTQRLWKPYLPVAGENRLYSFKVHKQPHNNVQFEAVSQTATISYIFSDEYIVELRKCQADASVAYVSDEDKVKLHEWSRVVHHNFGQRPSTFKGTGGVVRLRYAAGDKQGKPTGKTLNFKGFWEKINKSLLKKLNKLKKKKKGGKRKR